ncbi:MAG: thermonuclease family protein [Rhodospirillales bacterium]|nr:thermonuclease family protein [Rhodospirillales bacterium]
MSQRAGHRLSRARRAPALLFAASLTAACAAGPEPLYGELRGTPQVIAGDLIELQGQRLRLAGIDAPEPGQQCLFRDKLYDCGELARAALLDLTAGVEVICQPLAGGTAEAKPGAAPTARCTAQGYDLSEGMVYTGWALVPPETTSPYAAQQRQAEAAGHGLWRGRFVTPWDWVRGKRLPEEEQG